MPYKKLSIPDPCQQKWHHMKKNDEGRHCQSCSTTIIDFSDLTDEELISTLQTGKYHCGRFHEDQLGIMFYLEEKKKERKKYWNSVAAAIVAGVLQISTGFSQTDHQTYKPKLYPRNLAIDKYIEPGSSANTTPPEDEKEEEKKDQVTFVFKNKKYDHLMKGVSVKIKELSFSGTSNDKGEIVIDLKSSIRQDQIITVEIEANIYSRGRRKRGYHGKTIFLELSKLVNNEKLIYIKTISGHRGGGRIMGRFSSF